MPDAHRAQDASEAYTLGAHKEDPMNVNPDDPKWTAYVLGELEERDRGALESELEASQEARELVEELRLAASIMKERMVEEAGFGLAPEQRTRMRAAAAHGRKPWFARPVTWAAAGVA